MEFVGKQSTERWLADRARLAGASNAVFCNGDLVALILTNNVGPATFSAASQINSTAHTVCRTSMPLLKRSDFSSWGGGIVDKMCETEKIQKLQTVSVFCVTR